MSPSRRRLAGLAAACAIAVCGLVWRRPDLGLPWTVAKYGGSALWGAMVFCVVIAVAARTAFRSAALVAFAIAALVETSQLFRWEPLDSFRATRAGALLLGRTFDPLDVVAYGGGILAAFVCARSSSRRPVVK